MYKKSPGFQKSETCTDGVTKRRWPAEETLQFRSLDSNDERRRRRLPIFYIDGEKFSSGRWKAYELGPVWKRILK